MRSCFVGMDVMLACTVVRWARAEGHYERRHALLERCKDRAC